MSAVRAVPTTGATTSRSSATPSAPDVGGENIGVKEGTTGTRIVGNTFDGGGLTGANTVTGARATANPWVPVGG